RDAQLCRARPAAGAAARRPRSGARLRRQPAGGAGALPPRGARGRLARWIPLGPGAQAGAARVRARRARCLGAARGDGACMSDGSAAPAASAARLTGPVLLALAAVYLVWGSTYLGIRFALE